jgi:hypothetical protein
MDHDSKKADNADVREQNGGKRVLKSSSDMLATTEMAKQRAERLGGLKDVVFTADTDIVGN